ncbi:MAG: response regulator transcription factor [Proteobacteria bacterium]|nr:response regulator transcription factor [Pseudomonadota bacterium]
MPKVLLIDDDAELISLIAEYLEREGFEVMTAHNGEAGVAATLCGQPDIAVLDVMMPRQNGIDTLRRIRSASSLPVIMLTARGDEADRIIGLELGADDYVPKPCTPRELTARIRAILRRTQPALNEESVGRPLARFDRSIDVHVSSLRHKLGTMLDGRSCIQTIFRQGYQMVSE